MKIDFAAISADDFALSKRGDLILITPKKSKHGWSEDELHLRSLLCRGDGTVVSAGWPKFFNLGEVARHDAEFVGALDRGSVTFSDKLDGTLVILSTVDKKPHFRTRGNDTLGDFEAPVMAVLAEKYPTFLPFYEKDSFTGDILRRNYSLLFEYTAPTNRIVLRYDEADLTLLGLVSLTTLQPVFDSMLLKVLRVATGVPIAPVVELPTDLKQLTTLVRSWKGKEGVVARYVGTIDGIDNKPRLLKIKAEEYVKLHSLKFRLEGKVAKLAFLLGIHHPDQVEAGLAELGIDHEAQTFIKPEMDAYLALYADIDRRWHQCKRIVSMTAKTEGIGEGFVPGAKEHRKWFVEGVKRFLTGNQYPDAFFRGCMMVYDGKEREADINVYAACVLGESMQTLKLWIQNPNAAVAEMLNVPVTED